jgi:hypothetical protein
VIPIVACATTAHPSWSKITPVWRWTVLVLLLLPNVNVFWTEGFRSLLSHADMVWGQSGSHAGESVVRVLCAANGLALLGAWAILAVGILRQSAPFQELRSLS